MARSGSTSARRAPVVTLCRISNERSPVTAMALVSIVLTEALGGGASLIARTRASIAADGPSTSTVTPSGVLATQPASARARARP